MYVCMYACMYVCMNECMYVFSKYLRMYVFGISSPRSRTMHNFQVLYFLRFEYVFINVDKCMYVGHGSAQLAVHGVHRPVYRQHIHHGSDGHHQPTEQR